MPAATAKCAFSIEVFYAGIRGSVFSGLCRAGTSPQDGLNDSMKRVISSAGSGRLIR